MLNSEGLNCAFCRISYQENRSVGWGRSSSIVRVLVVLLLSLLLCFFRNVETSSSAKWVWGANCISRTATTQPKGALFVRQRSSSSHNKHRHHGRRTTWPQNNRDTRTQRRSRISWQTRDQKAVKKSFAESRKGKKVLWFSWLGNEPTTRREEGITIIIILALFVGTRTLFGGRISLFYWVDLRVLLRHNRVQLPEQRI